MLDVVGGADRSSPPGLAPQAARCGRCRASKQQYRVEPDAGATPRCACLLACAGPISPPPRRGDRRVVGHVLRLERCDLEHPCGQQPAQAGDHQGFPALRTRPRDQYGPPVFFAEQTQKLPLFLGALRALPTAARRNLTSWVRISAPSSVTTRVCSWAVIHFRGPGDDSQFRHPRSRSPARLELIIGSMVRTSSRFRGRFRRRADRHAHHHRCGNVVPMPCPVKSRTTLTRPVCLPTAR